MRNPDQILVLFVTVVSVFVSKCFAAPAVPAVTNENDQNEYHQIGWKSGFSDCQNTCSESSTEPDHLRRRRRHPAAQAQANDLFGRPYTNVEGLVEEESIMMNIPNSEAWRFWAGYADGYKYCTDRCRQFNSNQDAAIANSIEMVPVPEIRPDAYPVAENHAERDNNLIR